MNLNINSLIQLLQLVIAGVVDFKVSDSYAGQYKAQIEAVLASNQPLAPEIMNQLQSEGQAANAALQNA